MSWGYYGWRPYVPIAERRARAARELNRLVKKNGMAASPVALNGRRIAATFWGKAWCDNLEAYSDFANRLPRGRTYVRNGSVLDLQIGRGSIGARVSGSSLYRVEIKIKPLAPKAWKAIQRECAGKVDSLLDLLQGKLSPAVMEVVTRQKGGLFPSPAEIDLDCSCPDWADLCKHVAASLYGVGARLDSKPELLFVLRGVDPAELISKASAAQAVRQTAAPDGAPALSDAEITEVFGIELQTGPLSAASTAETVFAASPPAALPATPARVGNGSPRTDPRRSSARRRFNAQTRARIAAAMRARWQRARERGLPKPKPAPARASARPRRRKAAAAIPAGASGVSR